MQAPKRHTGNFQQERVFGGGEITALRGAPLSRVKGEEIAFRQEICDLLSPSKGQGFTVCPGGILGAADSPGAARALMSRRPRRLLNVPTARGGPSGGHGLSRLGEM